MKKELYEEIYEKIIYPKAWIQEAERILELEIESLLADCLEDFETCDKNRLRELLYAIQYKSVKEGFYQGLKFLYHLL